MTTKQENRLNMALSSRDFLLQNSAITKELPEFEAIFNPFQNTLIEIDRVVKIQSYDKTGFAKEKAQLRDVLILLAFDNSQKLTAFAKLKNLTGLLNEIKFTRSKLTGSKDIMISEFAKMIYDKAEANLESVAAYGITKETQALFLNSINAYNESVSKPRLSLTERTEATRQINEKFRQIDELLEKLDVIVNIVMLTQPEFYSRFKEVRKIIDTGTSSRALKASAMDIIAGMPLKGVKFTFFPEGAIMNPGNESLVKKTAEKGIFYVKGIPEGNYKIKISKTGYKEQEAKVSIVPGEMAEVEVEMEKE